jgi:hypothetical protein
MHAIHRSQVFHLRFSFWRKLFRKPTRARSFSAAKRKTESARKGEEILLRNWVSIQSCQSPYMYEEPQVPIGLSLFERQSPLVRSRLLPRTAHSVASWGIKSELVSIAILVPGAVQVFLLAPRKLRLSALTGGSSDHLAPRAAPSSDRESTTTVAGNRVRHG